MLMELAYRIAVEDSPLIQNIRKNMIVLITPCSEVDGHDREVDVYNYRKEFPRKPAPNLVYWGKYVAHDNNRDGMSHGARTLPQHDGRLPRLAPDGPARLA